MLFYILYTAMYSVCFLCAAALYNRNPDLTSFQMLTMRSVFALSTQLVILNVNLKSAVWDGISRDSVGPLIFRTLQGSCTNIINFSVTRYIPLTMICIVNNMSPLITIVFAFLLLKEKIKSFEIIMIVLTIGGVVTVVTGAQTDESD